MSSQRFLAFNAFASLTRRCDRAGVKYELAVGGLPTVSFLRENLEEIIRGQRTDGFLWSCTPDLSIGGTTYTEVLEVADVVEQPALYGPHSEGWEFAYIEVDDNQIIYLVRYGEKR